MTSLFPFDNSQGRLREAIPLFSKEGSGVIFESENYAAGILLTFVERRDILREAVLLCRMP